MAEVELGKRLELLEIAGSPQRPQNREGPWHLPQFV